MPRAKVTTAATVKKLCIIHPETDQMVDIEQFAHNPLTHDLRHSVCLRCTTAKETAFRIERAAGQLRRRGINPCVPITCAMGSVK